MDPALAPADVKPPPELFDLGRQIGPLGLLDEEADSLSVPVANADEVKRPDPGSWRSPPDEEQTPFPVAPADHVKRPLAPREKYHLRWHPRRHPCAERIIPKSRDFH